MILFLLCFKGFCDGRADLVYMKIRDLPVPFYYLVHTTTSPFYLS